ncbi:MAG TPA: flavin prenyltransferase UbiX [Armatimonadaceae bacterium]|jgi:4-hydroxy-3-polyprenylbenzoate decarboxylase|nr:flavin prenyltransferase UbiX [Armatimonadaceae bacterium]
MSVPPERRLVVAITGASGAIYGVRFLRQAVRHFDEIYVTLSSNAPSVLATELGLSLSKPPAAHELLGCDAPQVRFCDTSNYFTPPASGSFRHAGMVVIPCSMGTAGRIANGISDDLTTRAADVCLKEKRKLVLVIRETPWNLIHLRNMTQLAEAGATILPAAPSFYNAPKTIEDVVDTIVARTLQAVGVDQDLVGEWKHG